MNLEYFEENLAAAAELGREFMLQTLVEYGNKLEEFPPGMMTPENKVAGCASTVYIAGENKNGKYYFKGFSDSIIVKGQVYIVITVLGGKTANEIKEMESPLENFTVRTGINSSMVPTRQNSMGNIYNHILKKVDNEL